MAELGFEFDPSGVEPNAPRGAIPAGPYQCVIDKSQMKGTKSGAGQYLELRWRVIEGPHTGAFLYDRLNLINPSEEAVRIAKSTLSAICRACGVTRAVVDSEELHDLPATVHAIVKKDPDGNPQNQVTGYTAPHGAAKTASASNGVRTIGAGVAPVAKATAPWKRKAKPTGAESEVGFEAAMSAAASAAGAIIVASD